jgi:hypothetical protein
MLSELELGLWDGRRTDLDPPPEVDIEVDVEVGSDVEAKVEVEVEVVAGG